MDVIKIDTQFNLSRVDLTAGGRSVGDGLRAEIDCRAFDVVGLAGDENTSLDMWVDDEGMYTSTPNVCASAIVHELRADAQAYYFGTALFATSNDEGETIDLSPEHVVKVLGSLADIVGVPLVNRPQWIATKAEALGFTVPATASASV
ncbi:DUF3846 domain-containing protein [Rhodococcus qingshengii]|uniref:DUF3846 domain-containing protein n=1 Tax=Rhodococcus qingshengii TaxID=334542 RepID=UPI00117A397A|nr:DUF3846 domain-containing protein [Rhodococcus qingshengii]